MNEVTFPVTVSVLVRRWTVSKEMEQSGDQKCQDGKEPKGWKGEETGVNLNRGLSVVGGLRV